MVSLTRSTVMITFLQCLIFLQVLFTVNSKPNIVFLLADDLGWADISWNNDLAPTPHLQSLLSRGSKLTQLYTLPTCTPSRSALMTGIYPYKLGVQRGWGNTAPNGLPTDVKILPQYLKDLGYRTHMLGKVRIVVDCFKP